MQSVLDDMAAKITALTAERDALAAELARLRRLEEALPKTADGVPIVYGGTYWVMSDEDDEPWIGEITVRDIEGPHRLTKGRWLVCGAQFEAWDDECYSTLEAAREAEKARKQ